MVVLECQFADEMTDVGDTRENTARAAHALALTSEWGLTMRPM